MSDAGHRPDFRQRGRCCSLYRLSSGRQPPLEAATRWRHPPKRAQLARKTARHALGNLLWGHFSHYRPLHCLSVRLTKLLPRRKGPLRALRASHRRRRAPRPRAAMHEDLRRRRMVSVVPPELCPRRSPATRQRLPRGRRSVPRRGVGDAARLHPRGAFRAGQESAGSGFQGGEGSIGGGHAGTSQKDQEDGLRSGDAEDTHRSSELFLYASLTRFPAPGPRASLPEIPLRPRPDHRRQPPYPIEQRVPG
ncbi:hypothetical protein DFJ74DRAFT_334442 [Hyaloraphidium curvatum]|nr:hypothetical protein DFJ74DRAFT_334442 [Hyaloraphidium curvatum]